jgi:hypothetical protein
LGFFEFVVCGEMLLGSRFDVTAHPTAATSELQEHEVSAILYDIINVPAAEDVG